VGDGDGADGSGDSGRWIACNKESRIPISAFKLALRHQGIEVDEDEVECLVAGMIWKVSPSLPL
jgi:hypothetical protein